MNNILVHLIHPALHPPAVAAHQELSRRACAPCAPPATRKPSSVRSCTPPLRRQPPTLHAHYAPLFLYVPAMDAVCFGRVNPTLPRIGPPPLAVTAPRCSAAARSPPPWPALWPVPPLYTACALPSSYALAEPLVEPFLCEFTLYVLLFRVPRSVFTRHVRQRVRLRRSRAAHLLCPMRSQAHM